MNLNKLLETFRAYEKIFEEERKKYEDIISKNRDIENYERLTELEFAPEERETIARANYYLGELQKLQKVALFADYLGQEFEGIEEMRQTENYSNAMYSLKNPLIVLEIEDDVVTPVVNDNEEWGRFKEAQVELLKEQFNYYKSKLTEND